MLVYISVNMILIILALFFEFINSKSNLSLNKKKLPNSFFIFPSFSLLFIVSSFRGNFTSDYINYSYLFDIYNRFGFLEALQLGLLKEPGYKALNVLIGSFTDNPLYLFITVSLITLWSFYYQFNKYSKYIWLSAVMFVTVGAYYTSFNIMRQILAVAIVFAGSKHLYERNFLKYCFVVLAASLFHKSAVVMIVFYFVLNLKISFKNFIFISIALLLSALYLDNLIILIQKYFYSVYTSDMYGMTEISFANAVLPIALLGFCIFHYKKLDFTNNINIIWFNAVIFYAFFNILGLQIQLIQRISEFFAPYTLLLIPLIFFNMKNNELKGIYMLGFISFLVLYNYVTLSGSGYDPYYFVYSSNR